MKKIFSIIGLVVLSQSVFAQACPNGDFESWNSRTYSVPDSGWYTSNPTSLSIADTLTVWSVTGFSGQALHLQTYIIGTDTIMSYITNSYGDPTSGIGGVPYTLQPTAITGYYRYNLPVNDSAMLFVEFKSGGSIISVNKFMIRNSTGSLSTFTAFTFPITLTSAPDTVIIAASASNVFGSGMQSGSWLELDQLAFTGTSITQVIPDGNFETWVPELLESPTGWHDQVNFVPSISKSTNHLDGSYSAQLVSTRGSGGGEAVAASFITTGTLSGHSGPNGGLPYTLLVDTLSGYYKYFSVGSDTGFINITLMQGGSPLSGFGTFFSAATSWTYFEIPFSVSSAPDSMRIDIVSSKMNATLPGSILNIDHFQLASQPLPPLVVTDFSLIENKFTVYPNPASDNVNFKFANIIEYPLEIKIKDMMGRTLISDAYRCKQNQFSVSLQNLPFGVYFYELNDKNIIYRGKFLKN